MAGVFDADIQAAKDMIAEYGAPCLWQKPAPRAEGGTPGYPTQGPTPDPVPCHIAFFRGKDVGYGSEAFMALLAGTEIPTSGEVGLMAGNVPFTPDDSDTIIRNPGPGRENLKLAIKQIDRIAPNGQAVLYFISVAS